MGRQAIHLDTIRKFLRPQFTLSCCLFCSIYEDLLFMGMESLVELDAVPGENLILFGFFPLLKNNFAVVFPWQHPKCRKWFCESVAPLTQSNGQ